MDRINLCDLWKLKVYSWAMWGLGTLTHHAVKNPHMGVPVVVQQKWIWLVSYRYDPWPRSVGQGSGIATSCDVGWRCHSDPSLLWLGQRPAATALIWPVAWEFPYAIGATLKKKKKNPRIICRFVVGPLYLWFLCISEIPPYLRFHICGFNQQQIM